MKIKYFIYCCSFFVFLTFQGCKKSSFDINSNPNDITESSVTPQVLLPGALQATSRIVDVDFPWIQMWMGYWARSGSYQSITDIETYQFTNDFPTATGGPTTPPNVNLIGNPWTDLYSNTNNYQTMITRAKLSGAGFYEAIGRIMKAHNFALLVDLYNNVPYSDAFKGSSAPTPKYDKGVDIYKDLFKQLDSAVALLNDASASSTANNPEIATADLVYKGNSASWIRFANTLRLRLIIHLFPDVDPTSAPISGFDIPGEIAKITLSGAGFIASGGSAQLNPGFTGTKPNPFYRAYVQSEDGTARGEIYRAGKYGIEYYKYNGDPRIDRFYVKPAGATVHKGIPFGKPSDATGEFTGEKLSTNRGPGILPSGATSRAWILTSVESLFLQAEATERGILPGGGVGTASALLTQAVEESFIWLGLTSADGDTYLSGNATYPDVDYSATGGGLFTILSQKWFALNTLAPFEIYTDFRRTDYVLGTKVQYDAGPPISVDPAVNPATAKIPVRLFYPQNEYNYNAANVGAEGAISVFNNRIFWDKQ